MSGINFTAIFWVATVIFFVISAYLIGTMRNKLPSIVYILILSGIVMFSTSKIGRTFLGLE
jgi:hypothetical protein